MRSLGLALMSLVCIVAGPQTQTSDQALLEKTRALYDAPFRRGLINFDCAVDFDIEQHVRDNFGEPTKLGAAIVQILKPIHYRAFVDRTGAVVSAQPKLPDLSSVAHAADMEEADRSLLQMGLSNWTPHADGDLLPLGPTKYHFAKAADGYKLSMEGDNLAAVLTLNIDLHVISGIVEKPMHIEITTEFTSAPNGLVLAAASTNTNHMGVARYRYTYQTVDGFQIPESIILSSEQNQTWKYRLTDCKTSHGQVVKVGPPKP